MAETKYASFAPADVKQVSNSNLWDNVDAKVTGVKLTKEPPNNYKIEAKEGQAAPDPIFAVVDFEINGNSPVEERRVNQHFPLGARAGANFDISADGYRLVPKSEDAALYTSNFTKFIKSLVENGLPVTMVQAGDLSKLIGLVGHFKRVENADAQDKTRTFATKAGEQKTVTEKPKILLCTKVISLPTAGAATPAASAPAAAAEDFDLDMAATDALKAMLKSKKGKPVQRSQILLGVSQQVGADPNRAVIARRASEEAFIVSLAELGIVVYDPTGKGQPVSLPAESAAA